MTIFLVAQAQDRNEKAKESIMKPGDSAVYNDRLT